MDNKNIENIKDEIASQIVATAAKTAAAVVAEANKVEVAKRFEERGDNVFHYRIEKLEEAVSELIKVRDIVLRIEHKLNGFDVVEIKQIEKDVDKNIEDIKDLQKSDMEIKKFIWKWSGALAVILVLLEFGPGIATFIGEGNKLHASQTNYKHSMNNSTNISATVNNNQQKHSDISTTANNN